MKNSFLIIFLNLILFLAFCNSQLSSTEFDCIKKLLIYTNQDALIPNSDPDPNTKICSEVGITCDPPKTHIISLSLSSNSVNVVNGSYITCFPSLQKISFSNFAISNDFLTIDSNFPNSVSVYLYHPLNFQLGGVVSIKVYELIIYTNQYYASQISLDYFSGVKNLILIDEYNGGGFQALTYNNPSIVTDYPRSIELFSKNLPTLDGFLNITKMKVFLENSYSGLGAYDTWKNVDKIEITSYDPQTNQASFLQRNTPTLATEVSYSLPFASTANKLDLSINHPNLKSFSLKTTSGFVNTVNGYNDFQFSKFPSTLEKFEMTGSTFLNLTNAFNLLKNTSYISLSSNGIYGEMPSENIMAESNTSVLNLSKNNIFGTIDQSFCTISKLDISNNSLSGVLPSCFTCFMKDNFENRFYGNQFSNWDDINQDCKTMNLHFRLDSWTGTMFLEGSDLGFDSENITTTPKLNWTMSIPSTQYYADFTPYLNQNNIFSIEFKVSHKIFYLRYPLAAPTVTQVVSNGDGSFSFIGSDFSNDKNEMQVIIGSNSCPVLQSSFNTLQVQCLPTAYLIGTMVARINVISYIQLFNTQVYVNYIKGSKTSNEVFYCTISCNNGYCNTLNSPGFCECPVGYTGSDCSILSCPNDCSGNGICSDGVCSCGSNYTGSDCSEKICPNSCSGNGQCNVATGSCTCNSPYSGPSCSEIACTNNCSGVGTCNKGVCSCPIERTGSYCQFYSCYGYCINGDCFSEDGNCACHEGFTGPNCTAPLSCPNNCSNQGICDTVTGNCACVSGRLNEDCSGIDCNPICSIYGQCNTTIGQCVCDSKHTGSDCSELKCPNDCSGNGQCNLSTGKCTCNSGHLNDDCSGIQCLDPLCNNHGQCNTVSGQCQCDKGWDQTSVNCTVPICSNGCSGNQGQCIAPETCKCIAQYTGAQCQTPAHYITSVDPCSIQGGNVTIYGWFSTVHYDPWVVIGDSVCQNPLITESTIQCVLPAGSGTKNINVTQNGISSISKNKFQYYNPIMTCPNNCNNKNGVCDTSTGQCTCSNDFTGFDCSSPKQSQSSNKIEEIPVSITKIDVETGAASISNQDTNYEISIISLVEMDISGEIVSDNPLQKKWDISVDQNIYKFSQKLENNDCIVTYTIEEITSTKQYSFAGLSLTIDEGGLKVSVNISNYQYQSVLNTLQLRFLSAAGDTPNSSTSNNQCNNKPSQTDTSNIDPNQTLNYISITKNSKQLSGRFINKLVSDKRSTFMSSEIVKDLTNTSSIVVGLNLPNCKECLIDPDFSVLVTSDFKSDCDGKNDKVNWVVPVAVVIPVVAVSALVVGGIFLYRKHRYSIRLFTMKKSMSMKNTFKLKKGKY